MDAFGHGERVVDDEPEDVASGAWAARNRDLLAHDTAELGLRLLVA